jgi:hypothetical protein
VRMREVASRAVGLRVEDHDVRPVPFSQEAAILPLMTFLSIAYFRIFSGKAP